MPAHGCGFRARQKQCEAADYALLSDLFFLYTSAAPTHDQLQTTP